MTIYSARIYDRSRGRFIFTAPGIRDPHRLGQVTAGAMAALVARDGLDPDLLDLECSVLERGTYRELTASERRAMMAGAEQLQVSLDC
ncbi:MAG: hypothetical protein JST59_27160 [Actinobacteria bacterium]|nr:hypothetical protein [Actinomycetota bacterium]